MTKYVEPKTADQISTLEEAQERISDLETALLPFVTIAIMMAAAKFNLTVEGREDEAAGGYWLAAQNRAVMTQSDQIFFRAMAIYGAKRAEEEYCVAMAALKTRIEGDHQLAELAAVNNHSNPS